MQKLDRVLTAEQWQDAWVELAICVQEALNEVPFRWKGETIHEEVTVGYTETDESEDFDWTAFYTALCAKQYTQLVVPVTTDCIDVKVGQLTELIEDDQAAEQSVMEYVTNCLTRAQYLFQQQHVSRRSGNPMPLVDVEWGDNWEPAVWRSLMLNY